MRYGSVCSGIEAATVAWHPLGWTPAWFSEIEPFPSAVLEHHYPETPNLGDMAELHKTGVFRAKSIDLLVGGTPCQSFSVAGLRKGLADPRGNLALVFLAIADRARPRWVVWENVPGVLSSGGGRDFGAFVGGLGQLGYGWAYRVLDAQYFGVPQRRRRVFVVGHLGDWRSAVAVLFERHSLQGHPAPSREAGQSIAGTFGGSSQSGGFRTTDLDNSGAFIPEVAGCLQEGDSKGVDSDTKPGHLIPAVVYENHGQDCRIKAVDTAPQINAKAGTGGNNLPLVQSMRESGAGYWMEDDKAGTIDANMGQSGHGNRAATVKHGMTVRRLTPRECERLQGFPDDYTLVTYRKKPASDGPRYKALGNSMAVPVMRWIGERISLVTAELKGV